MLLFVYILKNSQGEHTMADKTIKYEDLDLSEMVIMPDFKKVRSSFRHYILGKAEADSRYYDVLKMMELTEKYHNGQRKNGEPEVCHQYVICAYLMTIEAYLIDPVACYMAALGHDLIEDYPESEDEVSEMFPTYIGYMITLSKERNGVALPYQEYFDKMTLCAVCSICKLCDRLHNISTMVEPFAREKQISYLKDLTDWFLPMLKESKRLFPEQTKAYENLKFVLMTCRNLLLLTFMKEEKEINSLKKK